MMQQVQLKEFSIGHGIDIGRKLKSSLTGVETFVKAVKAM